LEEGINLYAYVHNDPVNRIDPLGLKDCCEEWRKRVKAANDQYKKECGTNPYADIPGTLSYPRCQLLLQQIGWYNQDLAECERKGCKPPKPSPPPPKPPTPPKPKCPQPTPNA
jgi:uncharacterized protein RhaS with RHS repeats